MKRPILFLFAIPFVWLLLGCSANSPEVNQQSTKPPPFTLSPAAWPDGEVAHYLAMDDRSFPDNPVAMGGNGAVTTTYHAAASRAGLEALQQGGSSVDAAMTTALTQIALNAGAVISYFGIINMMHYDAASGEMVSMDATWNTVQNETDPSSIPRMQLTGDIKDFFKDRELSGRTALVGGFMKGVEAAHKRYGKLPFARLFDPAIYFAENGFALSKATSRFFEQRKKALERLPETRATMLKLDGSLYQAGDLFKQTTLANTLKQIAENGADYMYTGPWAEKAIAAIQTEGGKMTTRDLADYEVQWTQPIRAKYGDYEVAVLGPPAQGSINLIEALNLAHVAKIPELGHWSKKAESLRRISDVTNMFGLSLLTPSIKAMIYPDLDLSNESRLKMETANALWERMENGAKIVRYADKAPKHSDTVVAIDQWGNMTAVTHSINCVVWGAEAIVVDGVTIGDPASFQQAQIAQVGPGKRLPSPIEVGVVSRNGVPVLPFASMATGLHQQTVQSLLNFIAFDMDAKQAVDAPAIFLPRIDISNPLAPKYTVRVMQGAFPEKVREDSGLPILALPASERRYTQGLWIAIHRDPVSGELQAVSPPYATGRALAY